MSWTHEQVNLLIETYKLHPCLYVVKHTLYKNRSARMTALQNIVDKLQSLRPNTTTADVKAKFNALRTNFLAEHRKYVKSKTSGAGTEQVYTPTIWYYHSMFFVLEYSTGKICSYDSVPNNVDDEAKLQDLDSENIEIVFENEMENFINEENTVDEAENDLNETNGDGGAQDIVKEVPGIERTRKRGATKNNDELLDNANQAITKITSALSAANKKDESEIFFQLCSTKLRKILDEDIRDEVEQNILQALRHGYMKYRNAM